LRLDPQTLDIIGREEAYNRSQVGWYDDVAKGWGGIVLLFVVLHIRFS
jgi:hypothetical protein